MTRREFDESVTDLDDVRFFCMNNGYECWWDDRYLIDSDEYDDYMEDRMRDDLDYRSWHDVASEYESYPSSIPGDCWWNKEEQDYYYEHDIFQDILNDLIDELEYRGFFEEDEEEFEEAPAASYAPKAESFDIPEEQEFSTFLFQTI